MNPYEQFVQQTTPQQNPYVQNYMNQYGGGYRQPPVQQAPTMSVVRVSGENGAKAFQMGANSSVLLLDDTNPIVWLKTTDGASYPSLTGYRIEPLMTEPQTQDVSLEERVQKIENDWGEFINEWKSNVTNVPKPNGAKPRAKSDTTTDK